MSRQIDEDLIEATIRRVAEQKAQQELADSVEPAETAAAEPVHAPAPEREANGQTDEGAAEDVIEATVRRVAAEKALRERLASVQAAVAQSDAGPAASEPAPADAEEEDIAPTPLRAFGGGRAFSPPARPAYVPEPASAAEDGVAGKLRDLTTLIARLEAVVPALERLVRTAGEAPAPPRVPHATTAPRPLDTAEPDRIDTRPLPKPLPPLQVEDSRRGFDLLPRTYRITIEDKRRGVDLVPLHRALLGMDGVKDMSLLSYTNGVAIIALEMTGDLVADALQALVARAMSRPARVEVHNEHTLVVKLDEE
jgi:hypothetical protein